MTWDQNPLLPQPIPSLNPPPLTQSTFSLKPFSPQTFDGGQAVAWEQTTQGCAQVNWTAMPYPTPKASNHQTQLAKWYAQLWAPKEQPPPARWPACIATTYVW